jgi:hypothetical protein
MDAEPFSFASEAGLVRWTGRKADDLKSFLTGLEKVSGSSIYYHFYQSLFRRHFTTVDYTHDFARWALVSLNAPPLAERLAHVDPTDYLSLREAREKMIGYVRAFLGEAGSWFNVRAAAPFYFLEQESYVYRTGHLAHDLRGFRDGLSSVGRSSIWYHLVEARLRLGRDDNDFSVWLESALGEKALADAIRAINVHRHPLGVTRAKAVEAANRRLRERGEAV